MRRMTFGLMRGAGAALVACVAMLAHAGQPLQPRPAVIKPVRAEVNEHQADDRILVKFHDDSPIRLRDGRLTDFGAGLIVEAEPTWERMNRDGGTWRRAFDTSEDQLEAWRGTAQRNLGKVVADLNTYFELLLPADMNAGEAIDLFNGLEVVELAMAVPRPAPLPVPPSYQSQQMYLNAATAGIDALGVWSAFGVTGAGVRIADVEYSWNFNHQDLPAVTLAGPSPVDPFGSTHHGTAVLGEMASKSNGWGTTGASHGAQYFVAAANTSSGYNVGNAILNAMGAMGAGDIILIEQQISGPTGDYVPVEWYSPYYSTILFAVGNGFVIVEAAANGGENLDAPIYSTGNGGHWPFLPENDSGAIIVGAGAAPPPVGSTVDRSRLSFSNYGSTVDLQGWGEAVVTTGYGGLYSNEGVNLYYTSTFGGTSSASPIVASAAALLQSRRKQVIGTPFTSTEIRDLLKQTGSPQQSGAFPASQNIGPRPNVIAAIAAAGLAQPNDLCVNATLKSTGSHSFTTVGATTDGPGEPQLCANAGDSHIQNDVWFKYLSPCTGTTTVSLCGATFNTKLAVYASGCPTMSGDALACNDDFCGSSSQVSFASITSTLYRIRLGGFNGATGTGTMVITCTPQPVCAADVTGDNVVNVSDLLGVIDSWGLCSQPCPPNCVADVNDDCTVNVSDLLGVIESWGACP